MQPFRFVALTGSAVAVAAMATVACGSLSDPTATGDPAQPAARLSPATPAPDAVEPIPAPGGIVGVWASGDQLRLELRPDGTFVEDLGPRTAAYQGRYTLNGTRLRLDADSGATATGTLTDNNTIQLSGYRLTRIP